VLGQRLGAFADDLLPLRVREDPEPVPANRRKQFEANTPMARPGTPEDIAAAALFLASDAASWVTGKVFQIDGGTEAPAIRVPTPRL
jgi:NAD(P)-dependent dehydrogenase (short-subunit alcohol dehydrogenase family)